MIASLSINNFALIDQLDISFSSGFSTITGETGAGKSILLGALGLVLGKRADLSSLKNKDEKCVIEAHFQISAYDLRPFFEAHDIDYESETIIRREILPSGKSRAFVNDSPINLQELQDLGAFLIDIHSQHQTLELSENDFQFRIIDALAFNQNLLSEYRLLLKSRKNDKARLAEMKDAQLAALKEQDYNAFLLDELLAAQLKSGEQEEIESEFEQLNNVGFISESLEKSLAAANDDQFGIIMHINEMKAAMQKISGFSSDYASLSERIASMAIELNDVANEISKLSESLVYDPVRLDLSGQKLKRIYDLQKKHQVSTVAELLEIQERLDNKAVSVAELDSDISGIEAQIRIDEEHLDRISTSIHQNRKNALPDLVEKWTNILSQLGMPDVRFDIEIKQVPDYFFNGKDELKFLFSANKGSGFGLLKKSASGGELSRIMLATKSILARYSKLPTIIFDEIDTGVSGDIADKMGEIMKAMGNEMQVFAITHLPQIAAKGTDHFQVFKTTENDRTKTQIKLLSKEERVAEIAQMLSGAAVSDSAINHAKALLN